MQNGQSKEIQSLPAKLEKIKEDFNSLYNQFILHLETEGADEEKLNTIEKFLEVFVAFEAECNQARNILNQSNERFLSKIGAADLNMQKLINKFNQIYTESKYSTSDKNEIMKI